MIPEPMLQLDDIQGLALPGFLKPEQTLIHLDVFQGDGAIVGALRGLLDGGVFTSGRQTLDDRRAHQGGRQLGETLAGLAFSNQGLRHLRIGLPREVPSPAFQAGMQARAGLLGDPDIGAWNVGFQRRQAHALLVVAGDDRDAVDRHAQALLDRLGQEPFTQAGSSLRIEGAGREHFGFADGISQPGIRGRSDDRPDAFITPRQLPVDDPDHDLFGRPGQHLVWPGEFVLGYPASSPDPRIPGPVRPVPAWMHNGSFLVYRRLKQDVAGFRTWLAGQAAGLKDFPGFQGLSDNERAGKLAAKIVGRWPSGAPLSRAPDRDDPALGRDEASNNDFRFDDDTPLRPGNPFPAAVADSLGAICPVSAHIRKLNVRDQASDIGGSAATQTRRILRVGVPYGPPLPAGAPDDGEDRGLLFMSIQASIEDQFEFLQARWMNNGTRPRAPGGHDLLVGQGHALSTRLFGPDLSCTAQVTRPEPFITMTGGGYFFVPSLSMLADLLA